MDNGSLEMLFDPGDAFSLLGPDAQLDAEQETRSQTQTTGARKSAKSGKKGRGKGGAASVADGDGRGAAWANGVSEGSLNLSSGSANGGGGGGSRKRGHQGTNEDGAPKKKSKGKGAAATKGGGQQKANDAAPPSTTQDTEPWQPEPKEGAGKKKRKKTGAAPPQDDPLPSSPPMGPRGQRPSFPYTDVPANSMPPQLRDPSFTAQKEFVDRQVPVQSKWKEGQEQTAGSQAGMMRPKGADLDGGFGGDDLPLTLLDEVNLGDLGDLFDDDDGDGMWDALGDMLGKEMPPPGSEEKGPVAFPPPASRAPPPPVPAPASAPAPFKEKPSPPPQQPLQQCDSFSTTIDQSSVDGDAASVTMELAPPSSQASSAQPPIPKKPKVEYRTVKIRIRCESLPPIKKKATLLARIRLTPPPSVPEPPSVVTTPTPSPARPPKPSLGPKHQKVASFTPVPKMDKGRAFEQGKKSKGRSQQLKAAGGLPPGSPARGTPQRNRQSATPPRPTQQDAAAGSGGGEGKEPSHGGDPLDAYMDSECSVTNMWQYVQQAGYFTPLLQALGNPTTLAAAERALSELLPLICDSVVERDSLSRDVGDGFDDMLEQVLLDECSDNHGTVPLSREEEQSMAWAEQGYQRDLARCPLTCRLLSAFVHVPVPSPAASPSAVEESEVQCCECGERHCGCDVERNGGAVSGGDSVGGGHDDGDDGGGDIGGGGGGGGNGSAKLEGGEESLPLPSQDGPTGGGEVAEPSTGSPAAARSEPSWSPPSGAVHGKCGRGVVPHRGRNGKSALASALAKCAGSDDAEEPQFFTSPPLPPNRHHHHHHDDHQSPDPPPYPPPPTARAPWDVSVLPSPRRRGCSTLDERLMDELEDLGMLDPLYDRDRARRLIKAAAHSEHSAARERIEVELGMWLRQDERGDMALCRRHNKTVAMLRAAALDAVKEEMDSRAKHAAQDEACERYQQLMEEKKKKAQADAEQRRLAREKEAAALAAETAQMFPSLGRLTRASDRAEKMLQIQQIQQMEAAAAASRSQGQEAEQQCPLPMEAMAGYEQAAGASVPTSQEDEGYSGGIVHCKDDGAVPDFMQFFDE